MKGIFKFNFSAGRMGDLDGVFIATKHQVDWLINCKKEVYFGEVLGKHSEIYGSIDEGEITFITDNDEVIRLFTEFDLQTGYNPFSYSFVDSDAQDLLGDKYEEYLTVLECYNKLHS